jgi:selenocysteine lyase/cysteine desulfurase
MADVKIDIQRAHADTPGVQHLIHLNNAGAALMPTQVLSAVQAHLAREAEIGGYEAKNEAATSSTKTSSLIGST